MSTDHDYANKNPIRVRARKTVRPWAWRLYLALITIFIAGILTQAFFAGAGIFASTDWMLWHQALGYMLWLASPLLLIVALITRLGRSLNWLNGLLLLLVTVQPTLTYWRGSVPLVSALHPVNALLIFVLSFFLAFRAWQIGHTVPRGV